MARSSPQRGRALIVEDEIFFALNLEADMLLHSHSRERLFTLDEFC